ncbi:lysosomal Pro-X carboxypeptidase-like [Hydractinia symbiolongicarpus]|uniref:lysosomal Pro-X carboxypeptidase-like n=1 Tax=Hydractinia symbiolongicarpus TaxID=13093 RepID=UPI00254D63EC|nr:lysosomal Pro-X carboxypeptidase-like [Hydractinia symbiolongicarpus]
MKIQIVIFLFAICAESISGYGRRTPLFPKQHRNVEAPISYKTYWYPQTLDHFTFLYPDRQFPQRYLVNDQYFKEGAPVFFYTGNEGDIAWFCNNTGFMWDIAPEFSAMLVFAEHRYYGESLPFGKDSYKDSLHLGYLTSEQALADYASLIDHIRKTIPTTKSSPFIAFGGSYGGMLAGWFRMKYPSAVAGAIAASAPILAFPEMNDCELFYQIATDDFKLSGGEACSSSIRKSWNTILNIGQTAPGRTEITDWFKLCKPLTKFDDVYKLNNWLSEVWVNLAMVDYPYPANFLEDLPAWPIKVVCKHLQDGSASGDQLVRNIAAAANVYFNYTGTATCLDINQQASGNLGDQGWDFQACTEMAMPLCQDGVRDMWLPYEWNFEAFAEGCKKQWGITTRKYWAQSQYGGFNINGASNIVFSNGKLDPWSGYGVLNTTNPRITTVFIKDGAHHLDLRKLNPLDPQSVIDARNVHKKSISSWIAEWHESH